MVRVRNIAQNIDRAVLLRQRGSATVALIRGTGQLRIVGIAGLVLIAIGNQTRHRSDTGERSSLWHLNWQ